MRFYWKMHRYCYVFTFCSHGYDENVNENPKTWYAIQSGSIRKSKNTKKQQFELAYVSPCIWPCWFQNVCKEENDIPWNTKKQMQTRWQILRRTFFLHETYTGAAKSLRNFQHASHTEVNKFTTSFHFWYHNFGATVTNFDRDMFRKEPFVVRTLTVKLRTHFKVSLLFLTKKPCFLLPVVLV